jgi:hypothetical protein
MFITGEDGVFIHTGYGRKKKEKEQDGSLRKAAEHYDSS